MIDRWAQSNITYPASRRLARPEQQVENSTFIPIHQRRLPRLVLAVDGCHRPSLNTMRGLAFPLYAKSRAVERPR
jgi:hypothetical protein